MFYASGQNGATAIPAYAIGSQYSVFSFQRNPDPATSADSYPVDNDPNNSNRHFQHRCVSDGITQFIPFDTSGNPGTVTGPTLTRAQRAQGWTQSSRIGSDRIPRITVNGAQTTASALSSVKGSTASTIQLGGYSRAIGASGANLRIYIGVVWDRFLHEQEDRRLHIDPFTFLRPISRAVQVGYLTPVDGTLNVTEPSDTLSATGTVAIDGTTSVTEPSDTLSGSGAVAISGSAGITEPSDTLSAAGTVAIEGSASITEPSDTLSATGTVAIEGTLSLTEPWPDTLSAMGSVLVEGTLTVTEPADSAAGSGTIEVQGTLTVTEPSDTLAATAAIEITGTLNVSEAVDTLLAAGQVYTAGSALVVRVMSVVEDGRRVLVPLTDTRAVQVVLDARTAPVNDVRTLTTRPEEHI